MGMSSDATIAWGIDLCDPEFGDRLYDSDTLETALKGQQIIGYSVYGYDYSAVMLVISRSSTWAYGYSSKEISPDTLAVPTMQEVAALNAALDKLGYTGPRGIKLILASSWG